MKAGVEPGDGPRPVRAEGRRLDRLAALARGLPLGLRARRRRHVAVLDQRRHRPLHGVRRRRAAELPVYEGELQARALGAAIESWDPEGKPHVGEVGELVLTEPMPSMPIYFWGDEDGSRYREAYFDTYPGIWRHGDWIEITERGTAIITGRSDATINRGGIRMGTAEIYRAVLAVDAVTDALVVDVPVEGADAWMPLFVVLREGASLTDEVVAEIRRRVREDCSPRHVPSDVIEVARGPAHALGQGARAAGQADPDGHAAREGRGARLARQPGRAGRVRRARGRAFGGDSGVTPLSRARDWEGRRWRRSTIGCNARARAQPHARRDLGPVRPGRGQRPLPLPRCPALADTDYAWSIKPPVNAAFIGAGLPRRARSPPAWCCGTPRAGARSRRCRSRSGCSRARCCWRRSSTTTASSGTTRRPGCGRSSTRAVPLAIPFLVVRQRASTSRRRRPTRGSASCASLVGASSACVMLAGAAALYLAPGRARRALAVGR